MSNPIWIYTGYLSTPICCPSPDRLLGYISQIPEKAGVITFVEGKARYKISARVVYCLAQDIVKHGFCIMSICGEGVPVEDQEDLISVFRKVQTERLYTDGGYIFSSATTIETAFRNEKDILL